MVKDSDFKRPSVVNEFKYALKSKRFEGPVLFKHDAGEDPLGIDPFKGDCAKIINSKAFRRLSDKPQVFYHPLNPHIRNRLSHSMEVCALAEVISDYLGLNTNLCRAIALGHDIGHVPFGHDGERTIGEIYASERGGIVKKFDHAVWGVVVAQRIERKNKGLNISTFGLKKGEINVWNIF